MVVETIQAKLYLAKFYCLHIHQRKKENLMKSNIQNFNKYKIEDFVIFMKISMFV